MLVGPEKVRVKFAELHAKSMIDIVDCPADSVPLDGVICASSEFDAVQLRVPPPVFVSSSRHTQELNPLEEQCTPVLKLPGLTDSTGDAGDGDGATVGETEDVGVGYCTELGLLRGNLNTATWLPWSNDAIIAPLAGLE